MTVPKTQKIPDGWREATLGEVVDTNTRTINTEYPFSDILYLDTGSITKGVISTLQEFSIEDAPSRAKRLVKGGDIVYSTVRPTQEHYGFIEKPEDNLVVSTGFVVISTKKEAAAPKYIYYFLSQNRTVKQLQQIAEHNTSAYPALNPEHIEGLPISLPPLPEQKAIADVLSSFDDKIELLREQNKTLEAMAQALFHHWFVDFEFPYDFTQGKPSADGKPYKSSDGKMVDSELGEIPERWRVGNVGDYVEIRGGSTPSTKESIYWDGDINWTTPKDLSSIKNDVFLFDTERKITVEGLQQIGSGLLSENTLLMSSRAPVGYLAISKIPIAINQGYIAFLSGAYFNNYFMYLWLQQNMNIIQGVSGGSTFQEISKSAFKTIRCVVPVESMPVHFSDIISPQFEKMAINTIQIRTLAKTRDTLLPKLMRGDVRVKM